jgi:hypothetical protein
MQNTCINSLTVNCFMFEQWVKVCDEKTFLKGFSLHMCGICIYFICLKYSVLNKKTIMSNVQKVNNCTFRLINLFCPLACNIVLCLFYIFPLFFIERYIFETYILFQVQPLIIKWQEVSLRRVMKHLCHASMPYIPQHFWNGLVCVICWQ